MKGTQRGRDLRFGKPGEHAALLARQNFRRPQQLDQDDFEQPGKAPPPGLAAQPMPRRDVDIVGAGITPFGKHPDATMSSLAATAIGAALADAGLPASEVDLLVHGNAMAGVLSGQEMIRGELAASAAGLAGVPVVNVENACATLRPARCTLPSPRSGRGCTTPRWCAAARR